MYLSKIRILLFSFICMLGILISMPNFLNKQMIDSFSLFKKQITLGLDLKGGIHLVLEVGIDQLIEEKYSRSIQNIKNILKKEKIKYKSFSYTKNGIVFNTIDNIEKQTIINSMRTIIESERMELNMNNNKVSISFTKDELKRIKDSALGQSIEVIRKRIDENGTMEPLIQRHGEDSILLQIPGFTDPEGVKNILGKTAKLTFRWSQGFANENDQSNTDYIIMNAYEKDNKRVYKVNREILLNGEDLIRAFVTQDDRAMAVIGFELTSNGAKVFADVTDPDKNKGKMFAIVLDDKVLMAPHINDRIPNGKGIITGGQYGFDRTEAEKLALLMRSGALPAPLKIIEEKIVGPGLGSDSIYHGSKSTIIAIIAVSLLMLLCYSSFGIFSVLGVLFNLIFMFACLTLIGSTLTLPGIAGIALTIGMAVDANVIINERIKEEIAAGKSIQSAINVGHKKSMVSIIDANTTTLIGALILYLLGTGPVQGFAVTLATGIITSMFTAIELTKFFITLWIKYKKPKSIWI